MRDEVVADTSPRSSDIVDQLRDDGVAEERPIKPGRSGKNFSFVAASGSSQQKNEAARRRP